MKTKVVTEKALFEIKFQSLDVSKVRKVYFSDLKNAKVSDCFYPEYEWKDRNQDMLIEQLTVVYKTDIGCAVLFETLSFTNGETEYKEPELIWVSFINKPQKAKCKGENND